MKRPWLILALVFAAATGGQAQLVLDWSSGFAQDGQVPSDGQGWYDVRTLEGVPGTVVRLEVRVHLFEELEEGNNGDLYAYLSHRGTLVVLLNRVGRSSENENGYLDAGFDVTLSDLAVTDIHFYGGNHGSLVTGTYQPDGRDIDPTTAASLFDTAPRQNGGSPLGLFQSMDPNGDWVFFVSDHGAVGRSTVQSWGITITVPEPSQFTLAAAFICCVAALARIARRRRT